MWHFADNGGVDMSRYDGLIIPRSYSEYLNKTDSATLSQMLQHLTGLWSHAVSAGDQKPVTSDAVNSALTNYVSFRKLNLKNDLKGDILEIDNKQLKIVTYIGLIRSQVKLGEEVAFGVKIPVFLTDPNDVLLYGYVAGNSNGRVLVRNINYPHIQLDHGDCNFVITYSYI